jgi:uncharacterized protein (DUF2141 family)
MKSIISLSLFCLLCKCVQAQSNDLTVKITGLKSNTGKCLIALYKDKKGFPTEAKDALKTISTAIKDGKCTFVFSNIASGDYAVSVVHDENDNGKLDTNFLGIPKEGIGTSNNAKSTLGPPSYAASRFAMSSKTNSISITIKYL